MGKEKIKNVMEVIHEKSQTVLLRRNFSTGQEAMNESETKAIVGQHPDKYLPPPWGPGGSVEAVPWPEEDELDTNIP